MLFMAAAAAYIHLICETVQEATTATAAGTPSLFDLTLPHHAAHNTLCCICPLAGQKGA
jgi:hypothetical protein